MQQDNTPGRLLATQSVDRGKKKIRAAHAKEKQQIRNTCRRPNRLNLLSLTCGVALRSKNLHNFRRFLTPLGYRLSRGFEVAAGHRPAIPAKLFQNEHRLESDATLPQPVTFPSDAMGTYQLIAISLAIGVVAFLYSSVGHAGASGYIATLTLFGFATASIKPTALTLNILVACIGSFQFWRAGYFSWNFFWPFALLSVPAAFLGGYVHLPAHIFKILVGVVLWFSAIRLFFRKGDPPEVSPPSRPTAMAVGTGIGLLSGLTGTGGGIFLTPLVLFCRWARTRTAAAVSALFILVNSIAGLVGYFSSGQPIPSVAWILAVAALIGGTLGSYLGSQRFPVRVICLLLASVLVIAGTKLIFTK